MNDSSRRPPPPPLIHAGTGSLGEDDSSAPSYEQETGFISIARITGQHQAIVGPHAPIPPSPSPEAASTGLRLRATIWGGATGLLVGVVLGVLNSLLEGEMPSPFQRPMLILALTCCLLFALTAALIPNLCHAQYLALKHALSSRFSS